MIPLDGSIVVVGASIAGVTAADELVIAGHRGPLVLVDAEQRPSYARPPLSKAVLSGADEAESAFLPATSASHISRISGDAAVALDRAARVVRLASGREILFDGLVIASGSRARTLADIGANEERLPERVLRTMTDARELRADLLSASSIAIAGGGVLGMELASVARELGLATTVVSNEAPLLAQCGPLVSELVVEQARAYGVDIRLRPAGASLVTRGGRPALAAGDDIIEADIIVTAIGDIPNVEWLRGSGIRTYPGVVVDERSRVDHRIVAAGDVTAFGDPLRRTPHWAHAIDQARTAALALLRGDAAPVYSPRPYFWTDQFGLALKMSGHTPFRGTAEILDGSLDVGGGLVQWTNDGVASGALAVNRKIPIPRLHAIAGNPAPLPIGMS